MKKAVLIALILTLNLAGLGFAPFHGDAHALQIPMGVVADAAHEDACAGLNQVGGTKCGEGQDNLTKVFSGIVKIISYIAGIIAVIMVVFSGVRFTTSGGDAAKVAAAKSALVYALIGVAVAVLAQVLVRFVIKTAS